MRKAVAAARSARRSRPITTALLVVRNQRILHAWNTRQQETQRRAAAGLPPKTRKQRRKTLATLASAPP